MFEMGCKAVSAAALLLVGLFAVSEAYPMMSGGKRYSQRSWAPYPIVYQPRATRPYAPYYETYIPDAVDLYYTQDPYDKFRMPQYQMPQYYYPEQYYYDEEEDPEEDEIASYSSLPDAWYNSPNADANALFLQNLVLAQMYKDAAANNQRYPLSSYNAYPRNEDYDEDGEPYIFGEPVREVVTPPPPPMAKEDKNVRDLKSLPDTQKQRRKTNDNYQRSLEENRWITKNKRSESVSSTVTPLMPFKLKEELKGQDEVVLPRPATPARQPSFHQRSYQPSAYDAIKKLLIQQDNAGERQPQKRSYVLNEDSLVAQLGKLKKTS